MSGQRINAPKKTVVNSSWPTIPARLWQRLLEKTGIPTNRTWTELRKEEEQALYLELTASTFRVNGKSTFKEEFVTAGGIDLKEIDFRRFAVRSLPGLYAAGEVLNIDAITGGFNFQAAWTGGWLAGKAMAGE